MKRRKTVPRRQRALLVAAELLLVGGVLALLYLGWSLVVDNAVTAHGQDRAAQQLLDRWGPTGRPTVIGAAAVAIRPGKPFAVIRIPRFGSDWKRPVIEGTTLDDLSAGVGHYRGTAFPGQVGNFAVAGHRLTHGSAFTRIDDLVRGDRIVVRTAVGSAVYRVTGHEIVQPGRLDLIAPVPGEPGRKPTARLMTLTSCNPLYGHSQRYIVHAVLQSTGTREAA